MANPPVIQYQNAPVPGQPPGGPIEPFGQAGIRQHLGQAISWVCVAGIILSFGAWYRSTDFADRVEWRGGSDEMVFTSVAGRFKFTFASYKNQRIADPGWLYRGRSVRNVSDGWQPGLLKTIGIQVSFSPEDRNASLGMWIRIKWYFIAGVFAAVIAGQFLLKWLKVRKSAA